MERLLRKRERQGLTFRELSEESGIPIPTLSWWSRKLKSERGEDAAPRACEFVPIEIVEDEPAEGGEAIEIVIGDQVRLLVPPTASQAHVRCVLRAVSSC